MAIANGGTPHVVGLPAEVEDLLSEHGGAAGASRLAFAAAAGHVVVAGSHAGSALVFRADAGTAYAPRALRVPWSSNDHTVYPPVIAAWAAVPADEGGAAPDPSPSESGRCCIGVAALSREGTLRVYDSIDVSGGVRARASQSPACRELRLASILAASAGVAPDAPAPCFASALVYMPPPQAHARKDPGSLLIFGSQGSAALVQLDEDQLEARPLHRDTTPEQTRAEHSQASSYGLGTILYSVFRGSGWSDTRHYGPEWTAGSGPFSIVGAGPIAGQYGTAFCARKGGELELWDSEHRVWSCQLSSVASRILPADTSKFLVMQAAASSEQYIIALVSACTGGQTVGYLIAVDVSEKTQPDTAVMIAELDVLVGEPNELQMTISADIVYVHVSSTGTLLWISLARGLSSEVQVRGQFEVDMDTMFVGSVNISNGLAEHVTPPGGRCAFLESDKAMLVSAGVPPPVSFASLNTTAALAGSAELRVLSPRSIAWRAYVQYAGSQSGACKATLLTLLKACNNSGRPIASVLDEAIMETSRGIVDSVHGSHLTSSPLSLLVDAQLETKLNQHRPLLRMLADSEMLVLCGELSLAEGDRIWDLLTTTAKTSVIADAEKLESAYRVRQVENSRTSRILGNVPMSVAGSGRGSEVSATMSVTASIFGDISLTEDHEEDSESSPSVIADALVIGGATALEALGLSATYTEDISVALYSAISQFQRFLPALYQALSARLPRPGSVVATPPDGDQSSNQALRGRRRACRDVVLASDAALAVIEGASAMRAECQATYSFSLSSMEASGGWSCDPTESRGVLDNMIECAIGLSPVCMGSDAKILNRTIIALSDALLLCLQTCYVEQALRNGGRVADIEMSPSKRRRIERPKGSSDSWKQKRRAVLQRLVTGHMANEAFSLAHKYEDFGMMLSLRISSDNFDEFFESSVAEFGRDFAMFAFKWLEERGEFKLLLCGKQGFANSSSDEVQAVGRSAKSRSVKVQHLLREYFASRKHACNLSWMLELASGKYEEAAKELWDQATVIGVPDKPASLPNSRLLLSVAKLCLHVSGGKSTVAGSRHAVGSPVDPSPTALADNVDRRLYLVRAQHRLGLSANQTTDDAVLPADVLVRRFLDEAPVESNALSENAVLALETLNCSELSGSVARELKDFVWCRCIERQGHVWMPLSGARGMNDSELRRKLEGTALYSAARTVQFGTNDATDLIDRGVFNISEFVASGRVPQLCRLVLTTIRLAESSRNPVVVG